VTGERLLDEIGFDTRPPGLLVVEDFATVAVRVRAAGPPTWLVERLWPGDAYGVLGAEDKAGKTWAALDLAASVATGTPWLNHWPCPTPGAVLAFLGEGGERAMVRRLEAIAADRGADESDLAAVRLCFRVPILRAEEHVAEVEAELRAHPARLVILDPLYLAAAGAKGSDLYAMGEALYPIQRACQDAGASLVVTTHWNKTGEGSGARRFTGVGPGAWGRVLGSAAVEQRRTDEDGTSTVLLRWEFQGSEISDATFRMRRRVRAEDPDDLASPLAYAVEVTDEGERPMTDMPRSRRRVLDVLPAAPPGLTVRDIGDALASDGLGPPLRRTTIQEALDALAADDLADAERPGNGLANKWWATS
jgi:hypothetical protein